MGTVWLLIFPMDFDHTGQARKRVWPPRDLFGTPTTEPPAKGACVFPADKLPFGDVTLEGEVVELPAFRE